MLDYIAKAASFISSLGSVLMVPVMIAIIGLIVRCKPKQALKSGITIGIGLIGINLVMNLVWDNVGPVANQLVERFGLSLTTIDAGWAVIASAAFSTPIGTFIIPFTAAINIVLIILGVTKTLDIDIWNYWQFAFGGSVVAVTTGNVFYGFLAAAVLIVLTLVLCDRQAPHVHAQMNLPGVSISQVATASEGIISLLTNKIYSLFDKNKKETKQEDNGLIYKLGHNAVIDTISDPIFLGFILGTVLGLVAGNDLIADLTLGIQMAALMLLLPKMVQVLMDGLQPLASATENFLKTKFEGKEIYIGMDSAIMLGQPTTLAVSLVLIPIVILEAMLLPGNTVMPMADLASTAYLAAYATCVHRGKFFRTLIDCILITIPMFYIATYFAPAITTMMGSTTSVSAFSSGDILFWIADKIFHLGNPLIGVGIAVVLIVVGCLFGRYCLKKENKK